MSMEFNGGYIKSKKHLNSFHPKHGFFLHIDEVLSWFEPDVAPTWFAMVRPLSPFPRAYHVPVAWDRRAGPGPGHETAAAADADG